MATTAAQLKQLVAQMNVERQQHVEAIEEIDQAFASLDIGADAAPAKRRGRPPGSKASKKAATKAPKGAKRGRRGSFKQTADEFVLGLLKLNKPISTAQVNQQWAKAGRGGKADNTLGKLTKEGKIKREANAAGRGSQYSLAG